MLLVITGANRGIGLELTAQALGRGDQVVAAVRDPDRADQLRALSRPTLSVRRCDVGSDESVAEFAERLGDVAIDVLINNAAAYGDRRRFEEVDLGSAVEAFNVNSLGPLRMTRALLPALRRGRAKKVVSLSSGMASIAGSSGGSYPYRLSKAALNMGVRSMAADFKGDGIISVAVDPGWVKTDMGGENATTPVDQAAAVILGLIDQLGVHDSGDFIRAASGARVPW